MLLLFTVHLSLLTHAHKHTHIVYQVNPRDRPSVSSVLRRPFLEKHISKHLDPQVRNPTLMDHSVHSTIKSIKSLKNTEFIPDKQSNISVDLVVFKF